MVAAVLLLVCGTAAAVYYFVRANRTHARDLIERKQSEQREQTRNRVLELLAHGAPLPDILGAIVRGVEQHQPTMLCGIMLLDGEGRHLAIGAAPSLPGFFCDALNGIEIGIGACSCGTAAFTGQRIVIEDIRTHPYWASFRELAGRAGLGACWSEPIRSASGKVLGTFGIYYRQTHKPTDAEISLIEQTANLAEIALGRSHADQALRENEKLLSGILENVSAYIYMKDTRGRYLFANRLLRERFAAPMEEIVGYDDSKFYDADTAARMRRDDLRVLQDGETLETEETNLNVLTGVTQVFMTVKLPLRHDDGGIYALCGISTDITERKDIEEHMQHMAQYDALTHLPNRALFNDRLQQAIAAASRNRARLALMFIDLDRFKPVNDTYGHGVGDLLLGEVALRIQDCLRESDTAARIGGDEFVILLPAVEAEQDAGKVGEKIRLALNQPFELAGHTLQIGSSIGVAVYPEHGSEEKRLVKSADIAMYHAKKNGRNNVRIYQTGMREVSE
ncbi:MAG: diguanylate cyclase [Nitrosomonadales bacterium]|nr:diguanylate cyclase [Nitrosomonadales bacterium]